MYTVIFPDAEAEVIPAVKSILSLFGATNYRVATQRYPNGFEGTEAIIRADGGTLINRIAKEQDMAITLFVKDDDFNERYSIANNVAIKLEAGLPALNTQNPAISSVYDISITPIEDLNGETEIRYITFTVLLKGTTVEIQ